MTRQTPFFVVCAALLLIATTRAAAQPATYVVRNDGYSARVIDAGGVPVLRIDGISPGAYDRAALPSRIVEVPVGKSGSVNGYRIAATVFGPSYRATPLYVVTATMSVDSVVIESVRERAVADAAAPSGATAGIISQRIVATAKGPVLRVEVPLVTWDAAAGIARWIDRIDLIADPGVQFQNTGSATTDVPPFGSQRFIQRSKSLDTAGAWINYSEQSIRFHVTQDGMYKLTRDWFAASGFSLAGVDPSTLALYRKGEQIPMLASGLADGSFDANDYVAFEGRRNYNEGGYRKVSDPDKFNDPYPDIMNMYSDSTAYWIMRKDGAVRIASVAVADTPADTVDWAYRLWQLDYDAAFTCLAVSSERINNSDWTSEDVWYLDPYTAGRRRIYQFPVSGVRADLPARLWVKVAGWTSFAPLSPQFRFTVAMNSPTAIDSVEFDVSEQALFATTLPAGVLHDGNDSLIVTDVAMDPPAVRDGILDWYDVEYPSALQPNRDKLAFTLDTLNGFGLRTFKIPGVTVKNITVLKISNLGTTALTALQYIGDGPYTLLFADTAAPGTKYLLSSTIEMLQPLPGTVLKVENLRDDSKQAVYVLVTTRAFAAAAEEYRQFIASSYGLLSRVVTVEDIYDNYSYGIFNPEALKVFFMDASARWTQTPPKYLLLAGDANWNYKARTQKWSQNIVPSYGYPASDTWFVSFDSLAIRPGIAVGRLPLRSMDEFRGYLLKHQAYVAMKPDLWNKTTIHFTGGDAKKGEASMELLRRANGKVIENVVTPPPFSGRALHFYKTIDPPTSFGPVTADFIKKSIDDGGIAISYIGHSGTDTWDNGIQQPEQLNNAVGKSSMVTDFGCSTAKFAEPDIVSFSEKFVNVAGGQAIAYVGNSSPGFESLAQIFPSMFYSSLIQDRIPSIGEAHRLAKLQMLDRYGSSEILRIGVRCNTLIGDPLVNIPIPVSPNLVEKPEWILPATDVFTDAMDSLRFDVAYWNFGVHLDDSVHIRVDDIQAGKTFGSAIFPVTMPGLNDTLRVAVPGAGRVGTRSIRVTVDSDNRIAESDESDNAATLDYFVYSTQIKAVNEPSTQSYGSLIDIKVLNPLSDPGPVKDVLFEFDRDTRFASALPSRAPYAKTLSLLAPLPASIMAGKWFWRASLGLGDGRYAGPYTFWQGPAAAPFIERDSAEFSRCVKRRSAYYADRGMSVLPPKRTLGVLSAAKFDGGYGNVLLDGFNILLTTYFTGYAIAVFDSTTIELKRQAYFDTYTSQAGVDEMKVFLDSVQMGEIIAVTCTDEPQRRASQLIAPLRIFGSVKIDSLAAGGVYGSWGMIGWRGAVPGTVPEKYSRSRAGAVSIDTVFTVRPDTAFVTSPRIGPALTWRKALLERTSADSTVIALTVIGVDTAGAESTLLNFPNPSSADLSTIDAAVYPYLRLAATMIPQASTKQPSLRSWSVDYQMYPELAINYQSIGLESDTVARGAAVKARIGVLNAGDADARAFVVHVDVLGEDNIRRPALSYGIAGLAKGEWHDTTVAVPTGLLARSCQLLVDIDRSNGVREQFEDNNFFSMRFYVSLDTTRPILDVLIDQAPPVNGDYVRSTPLVAVTLNDLSPVFQTSCEKGFAVTLDETPISCDSVTFTPASAGQQARFVFTPLLSPGDHYFTFNGADAGGNKALDEDMRVLVRVTSVNGMKDVYTYPNPSKEYVSFLFILTGSEAPDGAEIKVYTVAGRLIKRILLPAEDLRIGYNSINWNGRDEDGDALGNGVYFYKIISKTKGASFEQIGKFAILK